MQKRKKQSREKNSKKLFVKWKGVNKMTVVFAAFMVSIGILGCDSMVCGQYDNMNALKIGRSTFGFESQHAH